MPHHRGPHNLAQRRAAYRCPGRPPHLRERARVDRRALARARARMRPPPVEPYPIRHWRAKDAAAFMEACRKLGEALENANREMRRLAAAAKEGPAFHAAYVEAARRRRDWERRRHYGSTSITGYEDWYTVSISYGAGNTNGPTTSTAGW